MRFKTDENLHPDAAMFLQERGHDALTVWDQDLRGRADADLAEICRTENRALITLDMDFADIRTYPPQNYAGLIVLRLTHQDRGHVLQTIHRMIRLLERQEITGRLWIMDEHSLRVRGGEE